MNTDEKKGHGEKYSRLKEPALVALLSSKTLEEAAKKAGIAVSTLRRWLQNPDFRKEYDEGKKHMLEMAMCDLSGAVTDAIQVLQTLMNIKHGEHRDRIAAAKAIFSVYDKEMQRYDTQRRLSALEQKMADEKPRSTEQIIEESQCCEDDMEEIDADTTSSLPEHQLLGTETAVAISSAQMSADGREKGCDGNDVKDLNHESTAKEGAGDGIPEKDSDALEAILTRMKEQLPETEESGTGSATLGMQMNADEHRKHEPEKRQGYRMLNIKGYEEVRAFIENN